MTTVTGAGAYYLEDLEGRPLLQPWNVSNLKKYFYWFANNFCALSVHLALALKASLFYYLAYFCYYLWTSLHFLVLFMSPTVLFQLTFTFIYSTFSKKLWVDPKQTLNIFLNVNFEKNECPWSFMCQHVFILLKRYEFGFKKDDGEWRLTKDRSLALVWPRSPTRWKPKKGQKPNLNMTPVTD